jgi:CheY-like chemotaxis protein
MSQRPTIADANSRERPRVLVIDDDPLFRNLIVSSLRSDYLVSVAGDGAEGFRKASEHPPDFAVIDIQMPGWDGLRTLKAFRAASELARVGTVMLTADASRETVMAAIQGGADDYVIKSTFSREAFLQKLARLRQRLESRLAETSPRPVAVAVERRDLTATRPVSAEPSEPSLSAVGVAAVAELADAAQLQELIDAWE